MEMEISGITINAVSKITSLDPEPHPYEVLVQHTCSGKMFQYYEFHHYQHDFSAPL